MVTVPGEPVSVTVLPLIVAGPLSTENETLRPEVAEALTPKGGSLVSLLASVPKLIVWFALLIVSESVALPVPPELLALKPTLKVPTAAGVPLITPLPVLTDSPLGRPLAP